MSEPELDTHAAHAAEYFWWTCRQNVNNVMLLKRSLQVRALAQVPALGCHFQPARAHLCTNWVRHEGTSALKRVQAKLHNEDDATFAFELFDVDGDGYVLEEEVHTRFKHIYRCAAHTAANLCHYVMAGTLLDCLAVKCYKDRCLALAFGTEAAAGVQGAARRRHHPRQHRGGARHAYIARRLRAARRRHLPLSLHLRRRRAPARHVRPTLLAFSQSSALPLPLMVSSSPMCSNVNCIAAVHRVVNAVRVAARNEPNRGAGVLQLALVDDPRARFRLWQLPAHRVRECRLPLHRAALQSGCAPAATLRGCSCGPVSLLPWRAPALLPCHIAR